MGELAEKKLFLSLSWRQLGMMFVIAFVFASSAYAQDRWITDEFEVMMRSGKGARKAIVRQLKSGTKVEVLESDKAEGYSRVRLKSGTEGWVISRYLKSGPTARLVLPDLEKRLQASEAKRRELQQQVAELTRQSGQLGSEIQSLQSNKSSVEGELERITRLSASSVQLDEENRRLKQQLLENEQDLEQLTRENERLGDRSSREWFLIGGVVLVTGLLLGLIIPRIRWRKKSSWSDF